MSKKRFKGTSRLIIISKNGSYYGGIEATIGHTHFHLKPGEKITRKNMPQEIVYCWNCGSSAVQNYSRKPLTADFITQKHGLPALESQNFIYALCPRCIKLGFYLEGPLVGWKTYEGLEKAMLGEKRTEPSLQKYAIKLQNALVKAKELADHLDEKGDFFIKEDNSFTLAMAYMLRKILKILLLHIENGAEGLKALDAKDNCEQS